MKSFLEFNDIPTKLDLAETKSQLSDLVESSLTWGELTRPDRSYRVDVFLAKYRSSKPFELEKSGTVVLEYNPEMEKAIKNGDKKTAESIGLVSKDGEKIAFGKLKKSTEFGGGSSGSGGGAKNTADTESAQCVYAQAVWNNSNTEFSPTELSKAYQQVDVDVSLQQILNISDDWKHSSMVVAKLLQRVLGKNTYKWYRGGKFPGDISTLWSRLNKESGAGFGNINKWSPADIWAVQSGAETKYKIFQSNTLQELNDNLLNAFRDRAIIGISLKKVSGSPRVSQVNYKKPFKTPKFKTFNLGKKNFFNSKDGYLFYNGGEMQFRTFPEFQCEIIGKDAKHGKVSQGQIRKLLQLAGGKTLEDRKTLFSELRNRDKFLEKFYYQFTQSDLTPKLSFDKLKEELQDKNDEWLVSKYMVMQTFNYAKGKESKFAEFLIRYAKSQSVDSAVFLKVM